MTTENERIESMLQRARTRAIEALDKALGSAAKEEAGIDVVFSSLDVTPEQVSDFLTYLGSAYPNSRVSANYLIVYNALQKFANKT